MKHIEERGYVGIGYHIGVSDQAYLLGDYESQRAHIAGQNDKFIGVALLGDFTANEPWMIQQWAARGVIDWIRAREGWQVPVLGHREKALPGEGTACPGNTYRAWIEALR